MALRNILHSISSAKKVGIVGKFFLIFSSIVKIFFLSFKFFIMPLKKRNEADESNRLASSSELNSWKRGFTPQAEIWNGRIAIAGLIVLLTSLLISNLAFSG